MDESGTERPAAAGTAAGLDSAALAAALIEIVRTSFDEHTQWNVGFFNWSTAQISNFQPIPPQANIDFTNRQNWMIGFMERFSEPAQILSRAGEDSLAKAVAGYVAGLRTLLKDFDAMQGNMAADNAATNAKIQGINNRMAADNLAAGAARLDLQNRTFAETSARQSETLANQRASFERMNKSFIDSIDN